jgi:hypothetical protein
MSNLILVIHRVHIAFAPGFQPTQSMLYQNFPTYKKDHSG